MCGIVGFINFNKEPASVVEMKRMTDIIAHRGPDGEGQYTYQNIGLGHRRLAVIDLSPAGHQPMATSDERYVITYNGEVYNYLEIRTKLEALGYQFYSNTDTEVVLKAYSEWKEKCVEMFNGMFAFAILDKKEKEVFLARDRYGIKPLYYSFQNNRFLFASEQKAIMKSINAKNEMDYEALIEYFTFQNIFTDKTFNKYVKLFPAGHYAYLSVKKKKNELILKQYWDYEFKESEEKISEKEYIEELDRLFKQAVNRQLISDVDIGAYLSGGMDSGSITAIAAKQLPYMKTFTCGFDLNSASGIELGFDEREKAEYMSYLFKTEQYEMVLKGGDMERCIDELVFHIEEPRVGQSYPNYYITKLASRFVKVVLSGVGGDELFAGYPWRYYRAAINDDFENYIDKYYLFWQRLIPNKEIHNMFKPIWNEVKHIWTRDIFRDVFKKHNHKLKKPEDYINHSLYFEAKTFLHGLLVVEDKISMGHSLETRVPFLDNDLVDFSMKIPINLKLRDLKQVIELNENEPGLKKNKYYQKTKDGKVILRNVMKKYLPDEIIGAVKQGFSAPDASWFRGESIEYIKRTLFNKKINIYNFLDYEEVIKLINEHTCGEKNRRLLIWSLINFNVYSNIFKE